MMTEDEKVRIRAHMGYVNVSEVQTFVMGIPAALQTQFMIEGALNRIMPQAEGLARQYLCQMDDVIQKLFGGVDLADVVKTGNIEVNQKRLSELAKYYRIAQESMGNLLGVPPNPFDLRQWISTGSGGINVPVG
jgi:hypothetical protein